MAMDGHLPIRPWNLRFEDDALEAGFREDYRDVCALQTRLALVLAGTLYFGALAGLDRWLDPGLAETFLWIRVAVVIAFVLALVASVAPVRLRVREAFVSLAVLAGAAGVLRMIALADPEVASRYYAALLLIVMGAHSMFRLRFGLALLVTLLVVLGWTLQVLWLGRLLWWDIVTTEAFLVAAVLLGTFASYSIERFARVSWLEHRDVEEERARSDRVLVNVFPASVAERLKDEEGPFGEAYAEATVLFVDIVNFTALSAEADPRRLIGILNRLFTQLDRIAEDHGVEKIKTSGDSWMGVAGVPERVPDHAERIADAALEMRDRIAIADEGGDLELRLGIAVGPVIAGVIGETKHYYDVWGDPVTMASRMQSHGLPGKIQVTAAFRDRLAERYVFEERGGIEVKGIGEVRVWWLEGKGPTAET